MPITDDEVVKVMAREMFYVEFDRGMGIWEQMCMWEQESQDRQTLYLNQVRAALAYVRPIIEREARVKALDQITTLFREDKVRLFAKIEANKEYTLRTGRGEDTWSDANQSCRVSIYHAERSILAILALKDATHD